MKGKHEEEEPEGGKGGGDIGEKARHACTDQPCCFGGIQNSEIIARMNITPPHLQHSHGENSPHLNGLPGTADRASRLGEVPHLSCESSQGKKRDGLERLVTPPRWGTSPTWGPPPPCEQALNQRLFIIIFGISKPK